MTIDETAARDAAIARVLRHGHTIDITTTGRVTGEPRRIEIVFFNFGGRLYISGMPNANHERAWLLNLRADPRFTFHLKALVQADLPATASEVTDPVERRRILELVAKAWRRTDVDNMVQHSPLVEVTLEGIEPAAAD